MMVAAKGWQRLNDTHRHLICVLMGTKIRLLGEITKKNPNNLADYWDFLTLYLILSNPSP